MDELNLVVLISSIIAGAAPVVLASLGETINEKAGVINLSLDGSILLSAMISFVTAYQTQSLVLGFIGGAFAGATIASIVGIFSIYLGRSQVAIGFVLTLTAKDLAYFIGNPYSRLYGPQVNLKAVPLLNKIPIIGQILFQHSIPVYLSLMLIFFSWYYLYNTGWGLSLRAVGENPHAAYARGIHVHKTQLFYTIIGGMFIGIAGATFSLCAKPGWGRPQGAEGTGWIALALVIFGGWNPLRVAIGAYLFSFLQVFGIHFQEWIPSVPSQIFQIAPFPLMIFVLALTQSTGPDQKINASYFSPFKKLLDLTRGTAPASLGKTFQPE